MDESGSPPGNLLQKAIENDPLIVDLPIKESDLNHI